MKGRPSHAPIDARRGPHGRVSPHVKVFAVLRAGKDDRSIAPVDPAIVALAAVQALNAETEAENEELRMKLETLKRQNASARRPRRPSGDVPGDG